VSRAYLDRVCPTYIENWAADLYQMSIPQVILPLPDEQAMALEACLWRWGWTPGAGCSPPLVSLLARLEDALHGFPGGAFVRLGSRSGKDSAYAQSHGLRVENAWEAVRGLTEGSEREAFDLQLARRFSYSPHLIVRAWLDIPAWTEFRCLMRQRQLIGISQYDGTRLGHRPEISAHAGIIQAAIHSFFSAFVAAVHLDDVVFDVFVEGLGGQGPATVRLLELNPFFPKTDACLFDWARPWEFDGSLRFCPEVPGR